jgi:hypothetical protein
VNLAAQPTTSGASVANYFLSTYAATDLQEGSLTLVGVAAVTSPATTTASVASASTSTSTSKSGAKKTDVALALVVGAAAGVAMLM